MAYFSDLAEMVFRSLRIRQRHKEICDCFNDRIPLLLTFGLSKWIVKSKTKSRIQYVFYIITSLIITTHK